MIPITLVVYIRTDSPRFLLEVGGAAGDRYEYVYAEALPDVMELLARWAPAVQAAALAEVIRQVGDDVIRHLHH